MRGVTVIPEHFSTGHTTFQSTLPMRGVTKPYGNISAFGQISIHTPHAGSDIFSGGFLFILFVFQSTLPMRGVTDVFSRNVYQRFVFQSTLPMRGVTIELGQAREAAVISIHTPHAGSDLRTLHMPDMR